MKKFRLYKKFALNALVFCMIILIQNKILAQGFHVGGTPPIYAGGNNALKEFIYRNLNFPDSVKNSGISGIVTVGFVINQNGKVEDIKLIRGIHAVCDSEAIRVIRLLENWSPAANMQKLISINVLMPIEFRSEKNISIKQPVIVTGIITDKSTGKPIEGTLVVIKGTDIGTITDEDGKYKLEVTKESDNLEITSMGYVSKDENIGKNRTINVELDKDYYVINFN